MSPTLILGSIAGVAFVVCLVSNAYIRGQRAGLPKPRQVPERVGCAPYSGPQVFKPAMGVEIPYLEGVPAGQLAWAKLLVGSLLLDEGAGYWHNTGHNSVVLQTAFTEVEIALLIEKMDTGLTCEAHSNDVGSSYYRWIAIRMDRDHPSWDDVDPYTHRFSIEVRGIPPHRKA